MREEAITRIEIDQDGRLCVTSGPTTFEHIYRAAAEVDWDATSGCLHSPTPRQATYAIWFRQIIAAVVGEYGVRLKPTARTVWINVPDAVRDEITG